MRNQITGLFFGALLITSAPGAAAPDGKNRKITIENLSSHTVRELYASPVSAKTWEEDLLGQRTLAPAKSLNANVDNGTNECQYDLKVVLDDKREYVRRNVNVCAVTKWTIGETGESIQ